MFRASVGRRSSKNCKWTVVISVCIVVGRRCRLISSLDISDEAIDIICCISDSSDCSVGFCQAIEASDNAVFQSLFHILNIASLYLNKVREFVIQEIIDSHGLRLRIELV